MDDIRIDIKGLSLEETEKWFIEQGLKAYRARQVRHWLFQKRVSSFTEMSNLSKSLRNELAEKVFIDPLEIDETQVSSDGTKKYLFRLKDGYSIESVLIPERGHYTLCISSQAGCAMGCKFCLTARQGLNRNLTPSEIIEQVIIARRSMEDPDRLTNIVFMGMGEPLANYVSVVRAIENITSGEGMNFSHRKVTLSTCGIVPKMEQLGKDIRVNLAVSLNATDDKTRDWLMPVNRKYPIKDLMVACRKFPLPNRRMITIEYILINDVNDSDEDAVRLAKLLKGIKAKINLIPLNSNSNLDLGTPPEHRIACFQEILVNNQLTAIIRKSKGKDISAACGQLSGEKQNAGN